MTALAWEREPNGGGVRAARVAKASPRVKMAARMYASGAVRTKREAARMAQIGPEWFTTMSNHNPETKRIVDEVDGAIADQSIDMSTVLRTLGREAIGRIRGLMREDNPHIALKAAVDLADRSSEVSKIQRHEIATMNVRPEDAKSLAEALVAAAEARRLYSEQVKGGLVRVQLEVDDVEVPAHIAASGKAIKGEAGSQESSTTQASKVLTVAR